MLLSQNIPVFLYDLPKTIRLIVKLNDKTVFGFHSKEFLDLGFLVGQELWQVLYNSRQRPGPAIMSGSGWHHNIAICSSALTCTLQLFPDQATHLVRYVVLNIPIYFITFLCVFCGSSPLGFVASLLSAAHQFYTSALLQRDSPRTYSATSQGFWGMCMFYL